MTATSKKEAPLTLSQLIRFYNTTIEPRFLKLEDQIQGIRDEIADMRAQILDLYKKNEDLRSEYLVICEQLKRIETQVQNNSRDIRSVDERMTRIEGKLDRSADLPLFRQELDGLRKRIDDLERSRKPH